MEAASRTLEQTIRNMAKDIRDKYLAPPGTTDFGIMFLPFESIYGEVTRRAALLEQLQQDYHVIVTGPTTLAAILNSLQMGFRTLAIQKRSSEVWRVLGGVKAEFEKFGGLLEKAQKNLQTANNQLEEVMGKRTRAIQRQLRSVEPCPRKTPVWTCRKSPMMKYRKTKKKLPGKAAAFILYFLHIQIRGTGIFINDIFYPTKPPFTIQLNNWSRGNSCSRRNIKQNKLSIFQPHA